MDVLAIWPVAFAVDLGRYLIVGGAAFAIFWLWRGGFFEHRRIQKRRPRRARMLYEFRYSVLAAIVFGGVGTLVFLGKKAGIFEVYSDIDEYGWAYFAFSIVALILLHDTYFYFTHRLMHHRRLYRFFHKVHHMSTNPSPWAAYSFSPAEAFVEAGIVPVALAIMPIHELALFIFLGFMISMNVMGHLGIELFPGWWSRHPIAGLLNTATHHNLHHRHFTSNYSLYFNWWDRLFGTMHSAYHERFAEITTAPVLAPKVAPGESSMANQR